MGGYVVELILLFWMMSVDLLKIVFLVCFCRVLYDRKVSLSDTSIASLFVVYIYTAVQ